MLDRPLFVILYLCVQYLHLIVYTCVCYVLICIYVYILSFSYFIYFTYFVIFDIFDPQNDMSIILIYFIPLIILLFSFIYIYIRVPQYNVFTSGKSCLRRFVSDLSGRFVRQADPRFVTLLELFQGPGTTPNDPKSKKEPDPPNIIEIRALWLELWPSEICI